MCTVKVMDQDFFLPSILQYRSNQISNGVVSHRLMAGSVNRQHPKSYKRPLYNLETT